jgi:hypothetical protein
MGRLEKFRNFHGIDLMSDVFVETGTFRGETTVAAINAGYPEVHTIDVVEEYSRKVKADYIKDPRLHCHTGTSPDVLPKILDKNKFTTFWLDAHFQAYKENETCEKYGECPVLEELKVIFSIPWVKPPIILVDDARMFDGPTPKFKADDWPRREQIEQMLPEGYKMQTLEDILVITHQ